MIQAIRDFGLLRSAALAAATVISFEAESQLAMLAGVGSTVSYAMPIAVDALMIASLRSRRFAAVACASVLMGTANAASHLLSHESGAVSPGIVAAVSVIPVLVLLLLELLVPAATAVSPETREAQPHVCETPEPVVETVLVSQPPVHPVSYADAETLRDALLPRETEPETADETPSLIVDDPRARAEELYAYGVSVNDALSQLPCSKATLYRWYRDFRESGVKQLATSAA